MKLLSTTLALSVCLCLLNSCATSKAENPIQAPQPYSHSTLPESGYNASMTAQRMIQY